MMATALSPTVTRLWVPPVLALLLVFSFTGGCGWQLRGVADLPPEMAQVYVEGLSRRSRFVQDLNENLSFSGGGVTADRESAGVILNVFDEQFERRVVSLSEQGKANEYELAYRIRFELQKPDGKTLLPAQIIEIVRAYFNPQVEVIGKSEEEAEIRREMYKEAVRTLLRRSEIALTHSRSAVRQP